MTLIIAMAISISIQRHHHCPRPSHFLPRRHFSPSSNLQLWPLFSCMSPPSNSLEMACKNQRQPDQLFHSFGLAVHNAWDGLQTRVVEKYFHTSSCLLGLSALLTRNFAGGLPATPVTALHAIVMLIRNSRAFSPPCGQ